MPSLVWDKQDLETAQHLVKIDGPEALCILYTVALATFTGFLENKAFGVFSGCATLLAFRSSEAMEGSVQS